MRVAVIDANYLYREGLKNFISSQEGIDLIGEAANIKDGLGLLFNCTPDITIMDIKLGTESGFALLEEAKNKGDFCKFIILTFSNDYKDFRKAEKLGAEGYILKDAMPEEIIHAIKIVAAGKKYYDTNLIINAINLEEKDIHRNEAMQNLTKREKEVLASLGKGLSNAEIANSLDITEFTVKKHVSQILLKLGQTDRTQAALYANYHGLVT